MKWLKFNLLLLAILILPGCEAFYKISWPAACLLSVLIISFTHLLSLGMQANLPSARYVIESSDGGDEDKVTSRLN